MMSRCSRIAFALLLAAAAGNAADPAPPDGMALVPAGPFPMGNNNDYYDNDFDEQPRHLVDLPPFFIDIYPVTNLRYQVFIEATGHRPPQYWPDRGTLPPGKARHPVTGVTFADATAFAVWSGARLPTEQEWEKASRGSDGLRWPWGHVFDENKANVGRRMTTPVDAFPQGCNAYGVCDISGNVWEWTSTRYAPYPGAPPNRAILRFLNDQYLSVRGGSYSSDIGSARGADRGIKKPAEFGPALGFRTVRDVPDYAGYRAAQQTIELAQDAQRLAAPDITAYEEHAPARTLLREAREHLSRAEQAFTETRFVDSGVAAQRAIVAFKDAHESALTVRRAYQQDKRAGTAEVLDRLESLLAQRRLNMTAQQRAPIERADTHLQQGRLMEAEGGWGYAQMHGYIGIHLLESIAD